MTSADQELSPADFEKLREAFDRAVELSDADRAEFMREFRKERPRIAERLNRMLRHDVPDDAEDAMEETMAFGPTDQSMRFVEGYEILGEIGRGGMGVVYKAHQKNPDRIVALKMIRVGRFASDLDVQRFAVEVDAIAKLEHPNIVSIYEIGSHHGEHFFTMQLVEASRLDTYLTSDECNRLDALEVFTQVCDAVAYCHNHGIVHRDLKPSNVLLDEQRRPQLTDFGLAKHLEKDTNLTRTGDLMGTPGFMAPEQADGSPEAMIDARADVYSLGAILYKILTGKPPIDVAEVNLAGAIQRVRSNDIINPRLIDRWIPRDLETICMKCLDASPTERYQNAGELAEELRRYADREPIAARPISASRRLLRWSRQQPGLAVTWLAVTIFYVYHLACVYLFKDINLDEPAEQLFHRVATAVAVIWVIGAYCFQRLLVWTHGSRWPLYGWVTMEVALLTVLLSFGVAATSALVLMYCVLVAASVLRFQPVLVAYVTLLCVAAYLFQVWQVIVDDTLEGSVDVSVRFSVPFVLSILCIGLIQYFALRRSRAAIELISERNN